mmetsp:Transcript_22579/g.50848  ORF Transcript_22579/g.50848 Transcript_22579/m.50848 type:complete len:124 (-) Transcript_22579:1073-1444(-)
MSYQRPTTQGTTDSPRRWATTTCEGEVDRRLWRSLFCCFSLVEVRFSERRRAEGALRSAGPADGGASDCRASERDAGEEPFSFPAAASLLLHKNPENKIQDERRRGRLEAHLTMYMKMLTTSR